MYRIYTDESISTDNIAKNANRFLKEKGDSIEILSTIYTSSLFGNWLKYSICITYKIIK